MDVAWLFLHKSCSVVCLYPEYFEGVFVFWIFCEVLLGQFFFDCFLVGWINKGDNGSLETGTRETTTIDSREGTHDVVDADELWGSTFVVVDRTFA